MLHECVCISASAQAVFCGYVSDTMTAEAGIQGTYNEQCGEIRRNDSNPIIFKIHQTKHFNNSVYTLVELQIFQTAMGC
jgi:hypothetical protein